MVSYATLSCFLIFFLHFTPSKGISDEYRLLQDLFERREGGYNQRIRPVKNMSDVVYIGFEIALIQLINLDERNQIMKSNVWLRLRWCDYQLAWNPDEYGGTNVIRLHHERVWKPDVVLFNNADGRFEVTFPANVLIYANGWIMWIPCTMYKSSCSIDVTYFPFDEQQCELSFASWTYNSNEVRLKFYQINTTTGEEYDLVDISDYEKSGSWDLVDIPGAVTEKDNKTFIVYKIKMRRKTLFYTVNLIIPCLLISILSIAVFFLPVDAGEKTTMSVSILLALVVFLQVLVTNILPPSSTSIPLFAKYLLVAVLLDVCAVINSIFVLNWHYKTPRTHRMPKWVRTVFLQFLPKILFIQKSSSSSSSSSTKEDFEANNESDQPPVVLEKHSKLCLKSNPPTPTPENSRRSAIKPQELDLSDIHSATCPLRRRKKKKRKSGDDDDDSVEMMKLEPEINKAVEAVRFISAHLKNEDDYEEVVNEWYYVAHVIDRLFLYIYMVITVTATLAILANAPNVWESVDQDEFKRGYKAMHKRMIEETIKTIGLCPLDGIT